VGATPISRSNLEGRGPFWRGALWSARFVGLRAVPSQTTRRRALGGREPARPSGRSRGLPGGAARRLVGVSVLPLGERGESAPAGSRCKAWLGGLRGARSCFAGRPSGRVPERPNLARCFGGQRLRHARAGEGGSEFRKRSFHVERAPAGGLHRCVPAEAKQRAGWSFNRRVRPTAAAGGEPVSARAGGTESRHTSAERLRGVRLPGEGRGASGRPGHAESGGSRAELDGVRARNGFTNGSLVVGAPTDPFRRYSGTSGIPLVGTRRTARTPRTRRTAPSPVARLDPLYRRPHGEPEAPARRFRGDPSPARPMPPDRLNACGRRRDGVTDGPCAGPLDAR